MQQQLNPVQNYLDEINKIKIPNDKEKILDFLGSLDGTMQKEYLSFVLSQSHIFTGMTTILDTYTNNDFYYEAGYSERAGNAVPKLNNEGKLYYEKPVSSESIYNACRKILESLQGDDKKIWKSFAKYVESIYEPSEKNNVFRSKLQQLNQDVAEEFFRLRVGMSKNNSLRDEINELNNKPVVQEEGFINKFKGFFKERKRKKEIRKKEAELKDNSTFTKQALSLIKKYKDNENIPNIVRKKMEFSEALIKAGLPKETFERILDGTGRSVERIIFCNSKTYDMLKHLSTNALIAKELYSPEILYANSFQEMTKNIRMLLIKYDLKEEAPITTTYREKPLKNRLLATEDISNLLKGKNFSQEQIQAKMIEYDEEFQKALAEDDAETYVKRCTDLMMKFVSTHPFDDGNGRTSRMLLQAMLARRGIIFPSNIDNYFERQSETDYCKMEDRCLRTEDYTEMENYIIERAKKFNNGELALNDTPITFEENKIQKTLEQDKIRE